MHGHLTETMFPFFYGIPSLKTCVPFPCFRFINPMSYIKTLDQCSTHRDHSPSDFTVCPRRANNQMIRQTTTGLPNQYLSLFESCVMELFSVVLHVVLFTSLFYCVSYFQKLQFSTGRYKRILPHFP